MRILLFALLFSIGFISNAQILDPKEDWFGLFSFFNQIEVASHGIQKIHIKIQTKKDGDPILDYCDFLAYNFNAKGQLICAEKSIQLGHIIDTAKYIYRYNLNGDIICRKEIQRNIKFSFLWYYNNAIPYRTIKLDEHLHPIDTLYDRSLIGENSKHESIVKTLNDNGLPFVIQTKTFQGGLLISNRIEYIRNQNYQEISFGYENGKLIRKNLHSQFGVSKDSYWIYTYDSNQLVNAVFYKGNQRYLKRLFTYRKDGLMKDVIERNFIEKNLKIYYFSYDL